MTDDSTEKPSPSNIKFIARLEINGVVVKDYEAETHQGAIDSAVAAVTYPPGIFPLFHEKKTITFMG